MLIKKEKLKSGRYMIGIHFENDDHYVDYVFCDESEIEIYTQWALDRIKELN